MFFQYISRIISPFRNYYLTVYTQLFQNNRSFYSSVQSGSIFVKKNLAFSGISSQKLTLTLGKCGAQWSNNIPVSALIQGKNIKVTFNQYKLLSFPYRLNRCIKPEKRFSFL
ncbi:MAG: hypothetical protein DRP59_08490 [Spirochaetes bacterium]|nr:MAG: hypothetical protein DRP59_08490 [Spirochaetota bacterium]